MAKLVVAFRIGTKGHSLELPYAYHETLWRIAISRKTTMNSVLVEACKKYGVSRTAVCRYIKRDCAADLKRMEGVKPKFKIIRTIEVKSDPSKN